PENPRKYVRLPIDHIGIAIATRRDQPDVFGNGRVRRAGPLAIHDLVEVVSCRNVGRSHFLLDRALRSLWSGRARDASQVGPTPSVRLSVPNPGRILVARSEDCQQ